MLQYLFDGVLTGVLYSLFAVGFAMVYNTTRIFHLAAAGIYVFAGFCFHFITEKTGMPLVVSAFLAVLAAALLSGACEWCAYRPLSRRKATPNTMIVASIGLMTIIINSLAVTMGPSVRTIAHPFNHSFQIGSVCLTTGQQAQLLIGGIILLVTLLIVAFTPAGTRLKAASYDSGLYESLGYSMGRIRSAVFLAGGFLIAVSACLNAYEVSFSLDMGFSALISALIAMIIGGVGSLAAAVMGGMLLGILESLLRMLPGFAAAEQWISAIVLGVLLLFLFFRPQGLAGIKMREV